MAADSGGNREWSHAERQPERADYRLFIEREWADVHHSRGQEWTALGVVTGAHLGLLQLVLLVRDLPTSLALPVVVVGAGLVGLVFAALGVLMTLRHRRLMAIKIGWIYRAEDALGLVEREGSPGGIVPRKPGFERPIGWAGLMLPRFLSTSWLILCFYLLLGLLDLAAVALVALF